MRILRRWVLPLLTLLLVLAAILLPPYLSRVGDRKLMNAVHTETVSGDRLSLNVATLAQRIQMLYRWTNGEQISAVTQPLTEVEIEEKIQSTVYAAYDDICQKVPLLAETIEGKWAPDGMNGSRMLLRDPDSGLTASLLQLKGVGPSELILDEQSGLILSFILSGEHIHLEEFYGGASTVCALEYFEYLGMGGALVSSGATGTVLRIPDYDVEYLIQNGSSIFAIRPVDYREDFLNF